MSEPAPSPPTTWSRSTRATFAVFLVSGFAALIYQVVWQRALFSIYGINVESVTVVVTAFMLGLGVGSLVGGAMSKDPRRPVLLLFSLVELGIGLFGLFSLPIFAWVGGATLRMSPVGTALVTFLLVLFPTVLMGMTLPLLVAHLVRVSGSVGRSVGTLYSVNTLGSAFAAFVSVLFLMGNLGQLGSTRAAAVCNFLVSAVVLLEHARVRRAEAGR